MQLIFSLASVVFLLSDTQLYPGQTGINHPKVKLCIVIGCMCFIWLLSATDNMQPKPDVEIVPNNVFQVQSVDGSELEEQEVVLGSNVIDIRNGNTLEYENYMVTRKNKSDGSERTIYTVRRSVPAYTYQINVAPSVEDILNKSKMGSMILIVLGTLAFGFTIFFTSKKDQMAKRKLFAALMTLTAALASPGLF